jgi:hypothetical protein
MEKFDFTFYQVSRTAHKELQSLFDKPLLKIDFDSELVKTQKVLYDMLVKFNLKKEDYVCKKKIKKNK